MTLNINIAFHSPPHFLGDAPQLPPKDVEAPLIVQAVETAVAEAIEAGFFIAGGCMTVTIQAARKV